MSGNIYSGNSWFWFTHYFPPSLSIGQSPNCYDDNWDENLYINAKDMFTGKGCHANFSVSNYGANWVNCGMSIQGFWIIPVRGDYETQSLDGYTYVAVI